MGDARRLAERSDDLVSGHYYIDRDGEVEEWVPIDRVAHHVEGHNSGSIGIELVNRGRYPNHFSAHSQVPDDPFPAQQLAALESLLTVLQEKCPRPLVLVRHSDLDSRTVPADDEPSILVHKKIDPGPKFP